MNGVGKPCAGERHARFDRGPLGKVTCTSEIERNPKVTTLCGATVSRRCDYSLNQRPTSQAPHWSAGLTSHPTLATVMGLVVLELTLRLSWLFDPAHQRMG